MDRIRNFLKPSTTPNTTPSNAPGTSAPATATPLSPGAGSASDMPTRRVSTGKTMRPQGASSTARVAPGAFPETMIPNANAAVALNRLFKRCAADKQQIIRQQALKDRALSDDLACLKAGSNANAQEAQAAALRIVKHPVVGPVVQEVFAHDVQLRRDTLQAACETAEARFTKTHAGQKFEIDVLKNQAASLGGNGFLTGTESKHISFTDPNNPDQIHLINSSNMQIKAPFFEVPDEQIDMDNFFSRVGGDFMTLHDFAAVSKKLALQADSTQIAADCLIRCAGDMPEPAAKSVHTVLNQAVRELHSEYVEKLNIEDGDETSNNPGREYMIRATCLLGDLMLEISEDQQHAETVALFQKMVGIGAGTTNGVEHPQGLMLCAGLGQFNNYTPLAKLFNQLMTQAPTAKREEYAKGMIKSMSNPVFLATLPALGDPKVGEINKQLVSMLPPDQQSDFLNALIQEFNEPRFGSAMIALMNKRPDPNSRLPEDERNASAAGNIVCREKLNPFFQLMFKGTIQEYERFLSDMYESLENLLQKSETGTPQDKNDLMAAARLKLGAIDSFSPQPLSTAPSASSAEAEDIQMTDVDAQATITPAEFEAVTQLLLESASDSDNAVIEGFLEFCFHGGDIKKIAANAAEKPRPSSAAALSDWIAYARDQASAVQ
jgi:hypothetical protein